MDNKSAVKYITRSFGYNYNLNETCSLRLRGRNSGARVETRRRDSRRGAVATVEDVN